MRRARKRPGCFHIYRRLMFEVARRADRVIAVSQSTRRDLIDHLACAPAKIDVTLEGVRPEFQPAPPRAGEPPFLLYVGRRDPYKNLPLLIEAFADVAAAVPAARLRIIGPPDARYPEAPARAAALGLTDRIDWVGYAAPEQLIANYQQAAAFVLPSQYEGFGLTVLEAMACGAPVVCSNVSSLPEVVGDAALLVAPGDRAGLARALTSVLTQSRRWPATSACAAWPGPGAFTWEQAARETVQAYERARSA
jgi:glycosyltransferase involved in cell wall biosynthesis